MNRFGFSAILAAVFLSGCILTIDASESKQGILTSNILVQESKTVLKLKNEIAQPEAATNCSEDNPCHNWGTCLEGGTCACRNGTSGTQCQIVDDCEELPPMCGKGTDVKCVGVNMVDEGLVSGKCRCQDSAKKFDHGLELCRAPCVKYDDCDPNGYCTYEVDSLQKFCECKKGVSGDRCEFIDQCRDRVVECGDAAPCTVADDGSAFCKCSDADQGFDYDNKVCRECVCGSNSTGCQFRKGAKECFCKKNTFNNGMLCEECQCGIGSVGCKNETGEKVCACYEAYKQCFDKCERCDCGLDGGNCSFSDAGEKQCSCPPGFTMPKATGICTQVCNATQMCQNGGTCVQGEQVCACTEDYTGDWCQTPKWCLTTPCGQNDEVLCRWNDTSRKGYCECRKPKHYYIEETRKCYECNCGENGECILAYDAKVCICQEGYADYLLNCKPCNCGSHSTNCSFYSGGEVMCHCEEGYKQKTVSWWSVPDSCAPCDCGKHGECSYNGDKKVCDCEDKYRELNGECRECFCGQDGFCTFDESGNKICHCDHGFTEWDGRCQKCDCDPWNLKGISNCTLDGHNQSCYCAKGFKNYYDMICKDIDECFEIRDACPSSTKCVNLPGTYECECKEGYELVRPDWDPKFTGCKDIDECAGGQVCPAPHTTCVNSPGSFDCVCDKKYYPSAASGGPYFNPSYVTCYETKTQWPQASIALGIILALAIASLAIYLCNRRNSTPSMESLEL